MISEWSRRAERKGDTEAKCFGQPRRLLWGQAPFLLPPDTLRPSLRWLRLIAVPTCLPVSSSISFGSTHSRWQVFFFSNEQINRVRIKKKENCYDDFLERPKNKTWKSTLSSPLPISRENYALYNLLFFSPAPIVLFLHLLLDILLLHIIIIVIIIRFLLLNMMAICLLGKKEKLRRKKTLSGNRVLLICFLLF